MKTTLKALRRRFRQLPTPPIRAGEGSGARDKSRTEARLDKLASQALQRLEPKLRGTHDATCPNCGYRGRFGAYGMPVRLNSCCPNCNSKERHRLLRLYADRHLTLTPDLRVLHFAPEPALRPTFEASTDYTSADISPEAGATIVANIEALDLPDDSYDLIVCCEVLEHVDDAAALSELFRVLRPGGRALLTTPVIHGWPETYENPKIIGKPRQQFLHFGQRNHVRYYGADIVDRIASAGFACDKFIAQEPDVLNHALIRGEAVFVCAKPEMG